MDKPTEWTYGGQLNWSSADKLKLSPWKPAFECIIQAIRERWLACFLSTKAETWDLAAEEWGTVKECTPLTFPYALALSIERDIDNLIEWSLNNTQEPYIEGLASPVFWTKGDLLEYLEIETFIPVKKLYPISAEWAYQCYQILNALKVFATAYNMSYFGADGTQIERKEYLHCGPYRYLQKSGGGETWAEAQSNFSGATETEVSGDSLANALKYSYTRGDVPDQYGIGRLKPRYHVFIYGSGPAKVRLETEYKFYTSFLSMNTSGQTIFDNHGDLNVENSIIKYQMSETLAKDADFVFSNFIPMSDNFNAAPLPTSAQYSWAGYGQIGTSYSEEIRTHVITCEPDFAFTDDDE